MTNGVVGKMGRKTPHYREHEERLSCEQEGQKRTSGVYSITSSARPKARHLAQEQSPR